ncbi:TPA: propionate--CoA ligase, partial [Escherichia coli]|nr:propionate--CoA ligase [Escherichia coli]
MSFSEFYQRSINEPEQFWAEQARRIDWQTPFTQTLDHSNPPFARWFCEGRTNLCHNAIDRWLEKQPEALAMIAVSSETEEERTFTFRQLHDEVNAVASMLRSLGVQRGDRVLVYMPMIAEAHITLLACARIGAIHSVVFGGFASHSVAARIDDAKPVLIVSADAGARGGKIIPYKKLLDDAISQAQHQPRHVLLVDRGLAKMARVSGRDVDFASLRHQHIGARVPVAWLESNETSCILYTSGTTGKPKGVQRDVGGYAVALATSMDTIFGGKAGGVFFCASDIGWVVGHSYIVYAPLLAGMATIVYEGLPTWPDCGVWWKIVEKYQVSRMFSAPTAIRVLKKFPTAEIRKHDLSSLEVLYLAGEPLDEPTASWVSNTLDVPVIDNYWQTESGWPIMAIARGLDDRPTRLGSPGVPMYGYNVQLLNEVTGEPCGVNEKGMLVVEGPLPPGCIQTIWGDDDRFVKTYWSLFSRPVYATFDWGIRDADGYHFILGRTDDVINVAGHRLGTREIEESISSHPGVAEVAVVGVKDALKGQVA